MTGKTHALSASATWLAAAPVLLPGIHPRDLAIGAVVAGGAALLPDLDHPNATATRRLGPIGVLLSAAIGALSGGHRQATHSLLAVALLAASCWFSLFFGLVLPILILAGLSAWLASPLFLRPLMRTRGRAGTVALIASGGLVISGYYLDLPVVPLVAALLVGYQIHLLGDAITNSGVPFFWPQRRRFSLRLFDTGSLSESIFFAGLLAVTGWLVWKRFGAVVSLPGDLIAQLLPPLS